MYRGGGNDGLNCLEFPNPGFSQPLPLPAFEHFSNLQTSDLWVKEEIRKMRKGREGSRYVYIYILSFYLFPLQAPQPRVLVFGRFKARDSFEAGESGAKEKEINRVSEREIPLCSASSACKPRKSYRRRWENIYP